MHAINAHDYAALLITGCASSPKGGSIDTHINHQGETFAPERPTYVIGGLAKPVIRTVAQMTDAQPGDEFTNRLLADLAGMVEEGWDKGATVVGWWQDKDSAGRDVVYFDASSEHDVERTQLGWVYAEAARRGELAVGLFLDGKYATDLNL